MQSGPSSASPGVANDTIIPSPSTAEPAVEPIRSFRKLSRFGFLIHHMQTLKSRNSHSNVTVTPTAEAIARAIHNGTAPPVIAVLILHSRVTALSCLPALLFHGLCRLLHRRQPRTKQHVLREPKLRQRPPWMLCSDLMRSKCAWIWISPRLCR